MRDSDAWRLRDIPYALAIYFSLLVLTSIVEAKVMGEVTFNNNVAPSLLFLLEEFVDAFILVGVTLFFVTVLYKETPRKVGLHIQSGAKNLVIGLLGGLLVWLIVAPLDITVIRLFGEGPIQQPLISRLERATEAVDYLVVFLSGSLLGPVSEEIFFRGFVYTILKNRSPKWLAIIATNLLFFSLHLSPWWFPQVFTMGVLFTFLFDYSGSLVSVIVAHSLANLLSMFTAYWDLATL